MYVQVQTALLHAILHTRLMPTCSSSSMLMLSLKSALMASLGCSEVSVSSQASTSYSSSGVGTLLCRDGHVRH